MTPAERQRQLRRRRKLGIIKIEIEVTPDAREALVRARKLGTWDEDDKAAVQAAMQKLVDDLDSSAIAG